MMKRKTVKLKLIIRIIPMVTAIIIFLITAASILLRTKMSKLTDDAMIREATAYQYQIESWLESITGKLNQTAIALRSVNFNSDKEVLDYLSYTMNLDDSIPNGVYLGDATGRYLDPSGWVPGADYVPSQRDWYKDGINNDMVFLGQPYIDADSGEVVCSASVHTKGTEVIAADIFLKGLNNIVSEYHVMEAGSTFIVDRTSNTLLTYTNHEWIGKSLNECTDSLVKAATEAIQNTDFTKNKISDISRIYNTDVDGEEMMYICSKISGANWILVSVLSESDVSAEAMRITNIASVAVFVLILLFGIFTYFLIWKQTKPLKSLNEVIHSIQNGDFTIDVPVTGNDEITTLSEELKNYVETMRATMQELTHISGELNVHANNSTQTSATLLESSNLQASAMAQMNTTMNDLAHSTEEIAENATTLSATASDLSKGGISAKEEMNKAVSSAEAGKEAVTDVSIRIERLSNNMNVLKDNIHNVEASTSEIYTITNTISDIATQTNLLALNASIEAARAGEAGKGFAVVATEISKLAKQSADAVEVISKLIDNINTQVNSTVEKTNESVTDMNESIKTVEDTQKAFELIYSSINESNNMIEKVVNQIKNIDDVATSLAAITEEQSAATEEALATTENMVATADHVKDASKDSSTVATDLDYASRMMVENLSRYKI